MEAFVTLLVMAERDEIMHNCSEEKDTTVDVGGNGAGSTYVGCGLSRREHCQLHFRYCAMGD